MIEEFQGVKNVYLSLPCILGENGVEKIISLKLSTAEKENFIKSAEIVKNYTHSTINKPT